MRKLAFATVTCLLFFFLLELGLRLIPLSPGIDVFDMFGLKLKLVRDDVAIWKLAAHKRVRYDRDGLVHFGNGSIKIVILTDSCGIANVWPWPEHYSNRLGSHFQVISAATVGYSSEQARRVFERKILTRHNPNLVICTLGLNDMCHWKKMTDREMIEYYLDPPLLRTTWFLSTLKARLLPNRQINEDGYMPRVPVGQFTENLQAILDSSHRVGAKVIIATSPFIRDQEGSYSFYQEYMEVVRNVDKQSTFDLANIFPRLIADFDAEQLFLKDGVHYSEVGSLVIAELYYARTMHVLGMPYENNSEIANAVAGAIDAVFTDFSP